MNKAALEKLLDQYKNNQIDKSNVIKKLKTLPFENLDFAKVDHHRSLRTGYPEVIFCQGKKDTHIKKIYLSLINQNQNQNLLLTRANLSIFEMLFEIDQRLIYNELAKTISLHISKKRKKGLVLIISAGTADIPVADEAAETANICGANIEKIYDVGVAGIHRLTAYYEKIQEARAIVAVAGMEGALPSVIGGMAKCPVIAVPTSVGYGAHIDGLAPLLTMLNSCSSNITVVNIDNGFGAGFNASLINNRDN